MAELRNEPDLRRICQ